LSFREVNRIFNVGVKTEDIKRNFYKAKAICYLKTDVLRRRRG